MGGSAQDDVVDGNGVAFGSNSGAFGLSIQPYTPLLGAVESREVRLDPVGGGFVQTGPCLRGIPTEQSSLQRYCAWGVSTIRRLRLGSAVDTPGTESGRLESSDVEEEEEWVEQDEPNERGGMTAPVEWEFWHVSGDAQEIVVVELPLDSSDSDPLESQLGIEGSTKEGKDSSRIQGSEKG